MRCRLTLVSYRLPVRFFVAKGKLSYKRSTGGLATTLGSYLEADKPKDNAATITQWVGISDIGEEKFKRAWDGLSSDEYLATLAPVFLNPRDVDDFYNGFCNSVLWPLFHYFPSYVVYDESFFQAYKRANQRVADQIIVNYKEGDIIWIHDYHFMMLPGLIRQRVPNAIIGFFLHIPFPSFELFRILPRSWQVEIMRGLMCADVVGFHTAEYVRHFLESMSRTLGLKVQPEGVQYQGRLVKVRQFPISIDVDKFSMVANSADVRREVRKIRERFRDGKIILSVDRLDYTKAIINRLESFEWFLKENPAYREKATYILLLVPTRDSILKYKENKLSVETLIGRINGLYGTLSWTPIIYQYRSLDFNKLVALYSASHIALITPVRDGMNLVAKEFVASRPESDGVLILSDTAGCAIELKEAIIVNPNDRHEIADSILTAMSQSVQEQHSRMGAMQDQLRDRDVYRWVDEFLECLSPEVSV